MKLIHTADWHLGNQMHDINRTEEYRHFFKWLKEKIIQEKAEVLVISGDVFDVANPSVEARKLYFDFLSVLDETECSNIVIIGGNHDSGNLLDAPKQILKKLNIHVVGSACNIQIEDMVFELKDKNQNVIGICAAVPFAREVELRSFLNDADDCDSALSDRGYSILYKKVYECAEKLRSSRKIPLISTGHLHASGLDGLRSDENESKIDDGVKNLDVIGTLGKVHSNVFPKEFDYVALGHIHYHTMVSKNNRIRYSGSPVVMGFDECRIKKGVLSVEISDEVKVKFLHFDEPLYVYERLQGTIDEIIERLSEYSSINIEKENFLELCYKPEVNRDIDFEIEETVKNLPEKIHIVSKKILSESMQNINLQGFSEFQSGDISDFDEESIFKSLIRAKLPGVENPDELETAFDIYLPLFKEISGEVENENN